METNENVSATKKNGSQRKKALFEFFDACVDSAVLSNCSSLVDRTYGKDTLMVEVVLGIMEVWVARDPKQLIEYKGTIPNEYLLNPNLLREDVMEVFPKAQRLYLSRS